MIVQRTVQRVAVAASGGRDSTALLHCTVRAAATLGVEVVALHVHHGLMPEADDWLAQVRSQAQRWGAAFMSQRLDGAPPPGASIEAWARRERYRALGAMAHEAGCTLVLLGHHRRDQVETWLLQALRSGGPAGLSAMPRQVQRQSLVWARPWLDQTPSAIEAYARRHRLAYVDDTSNADPRFARSRLRTAVWPRLEAAFPDAEVALVGAAARAQEAAALAAEVAALDLPPVLHEAGLMLLPWRLLPPARRRNALRAWLTQALAAAVPESLVQRLMNELAAARQGRWPAPDGGELRLYRGVLSVAEDVPPPGAAPVPCTLDLGRPGRFELPGWRGHFTVQAAHEGGALPELLAPVEARARTGGERFRLAARGTPRSLKKQYQAQGVPAWQRSGPLLFTATGRLLFAPGLGLEAGARAPVGQPQLLLSWVPAVALATGRRQRDG